MLFSLVSIVALLAVGPTLATSNDPESQVPITAEYLTVTLHPNGNTHKCLDVRGAHYADGTAVQIYDCNGTGAQRWLIRRGSTKVRVANTNFCLDAGNEPFGNGVRMKIWTCYDNLKAQKWFYTNDNRIALENQGFCLDLPNGNVNNGNQVQTWRCTDGNTNQIWTSL